MKLFKQYHAIGALFKSIKHTISRPEASATTVDSSDFNGLLDDTISNVQDLADKVDQLSTVYETFNIKKVGAETAIFEAGADIQLLTYQLAGNAYGLSGFVGLAPNQNSTIGAVGFQGVVQKLTDFDVSIFTGVQGVNLSSTSGNISSVVGVVGKNKCSVGTVTTAAGGEFTANTGTATIATGHGVRIKQATGAFTTLNGLSVAPVLAGSITNKSIDTNGGLHDFKDDVDIQGRLDICGTSDEVQELTSGGVGQTANLKEIWNVLRSVLLFWIDKDGGVHSPALYGDGSNLTGIQTDLHLSQSVLSSGTYTTSGTGNHYLSGGTAVNVTLQSSPAAGTTHYFSEGLTITGPIYNQQGVLVSSLQVKNNQDIALTYVPDASAWYLVSLGKHSIQDHTDLSLPIFFAKKTTAFSNTGGVWTPTVIPSWTQDFIDSEYYSFDSVAGILTFNKSGRFECRYAASVESTSASSHNSGIGFDRDGSGILLDDSQSYYNFSYSGARIHTSGTHIGSFGAGDTLTVSMYSQLSATDKIFQNTASFTVKPI